MNRLALLLLFLALVARAEDQTSKLTEAKAAFAKADRALNEAWTAMKKALPDNIFAELKAQQRAWLESRDRRALESSPTPNDAAEAKRSAAYWQTAASLTEARTQWLRRLADKEDDPLTGLWTDGNGGNLEIVERKEKLFFVFHVVRGRALHIGVLPEPHIGIRPSDGSATKAGRRISRMKPISPLSKKRDIWKSPERTPATTMGRTLTSTATTTRSRRSMGKMKKTR